jgi:DNA polymerase III delta subunit
VDRYSGPELIKAMDRLAETDRALKSSRLPGELLFQGMLLDLCAG